MKLHLGEPDFSLPLDLVTQTVAILAKKGVGKSYTASVMAEELLSAGQQITVLDPTGAWWGLRSSADGRSDGFPVVVFGGDHGDLPLEEHAGETVARWLVERRFAAIIDLSLFRKAQVRRFVVPFLETLYRLNREPMHLFVDEADDICPQKPFGDEAMMVGAMEDIVKRGRKKGIGCTMITQRPADLAKQVLTQCEMLVALRLVHPLDIKAVMEWVNVHADPVQAKKMVDALPTLPVGEGYFWSPGWGDIFERVKVRKRTTFDSGATPKPGQKAKEPSRLAPIDVAKLGEEIAATVEKAQANDPARLKKRVESLERELAKKLAPVTDPGLIEAARIDGMNQGRDQADIRWREMVTKFAGFVEAAKHQLSDAAHNIDRVLTDVSRDVPLTTVLKPAVNRPVKTAAPPRSPASIVPRPKPVLGRDDLDPHADVPELPKGERIILTACAQFDGCTKDQLTVNCGYKRSARDTYLQRLRAKGFIEEHGDIIVATPDGVAALGGFEPLPTGRELQAYWLDKLTGGERTILQVLIDHHPEPVLRTTLDQLTDYKRSARDTYLQRLSARKLIEKKGSGVKAADMLFD